MIGGGVGVFVAKARGRCGLACWVSMDRRSWSIRSTSSGWALTKPALACCAASSSPPRGGEPGPLVFEKPSVRFGRTLPGTLGHLERCGTGLKVSAASVPTEEPMAGILGAAEVLLVDSPRDLEVLVTGSDGRVRPSSGAGAEVGKVLFERGLLFVDVSKLVGDARRDAREKFSVLGAKLHEVLGGTGLVSGPLLAALSSWLYRNHEAAWSLTASGIMERWRSDR
jgi:hypothetical protein